MKKSQHGLACINNNFYKRVFKIFLIKGNQHTLYQLPLGHELKREKRSLNTPRHKVTQGPSPSSAPLKGSLKAQFWGLISSRRT